MATTFFFRAVASDGKLRTGAITGESNQHVARELRRQGLTPIYVGGQPAKSTTALNATLKLPGFSAGSKKDVLYFTQELSTLLNSGVPVDRALAIAGELTDRAQFRGIIQDVLRVLKGGRSLADSLALHPIYFSDLYINMVRAGEASGSLASVFDRLAEFERSRDDLRGFIVSSMVYPGSARSGRRRRDYRAAHVRRPALCIHLRRLTHEDPGAHDDHARNQQDHHAMVVGSGPGHRRQRLCILALHPQRSRTQLVGPHASADPDARRRAAQGRNLAFRPSDGNARRQ